MNKKKHSDYKGINGVRISGHSYAKKKPKFIPHMIYKINSKCVKDLCM